MNLRARQDSVENVVVPVAAAPVPAPVTINYNLDEAPSASTSHSTHQENKHCGLYIKDNIPTYHIP